MVCKLNHPKVSYLQTEISPTLRKISPSVKHHFLANCELFLNILGIELDLDPKIKVVTLVKYYNFYLGHTAMQTIKSTVQL